MHRTSFPTSPYCTIGPFFPGSFSTGCEDMTGFEGNTARGRHILLKGRVFEEGNRPILNAVIEIWQPDANGIFRHPLDPRFHEADPGFLGWGRTRTDADGRYCFRTVLPGASQELGTKQPRCPHINVMILAIGLTRRLVTTVFFADDPSSARDPVLDSVEDASSRRRMFAVAEDYRNGSSELPVYRYDIITRGNLETPFFVD
jgi:protocatechuate 3,4-dioxygenase alpha subunit